MRQVAPPTSCATQPAWWRQAPGTHHDFENDLGPSLQTSAHIILSCRANLCQILARLTISIQERWDRSETWSWCCVHSWHEVKNSRSPPSSLTSAKAIKCRECTTASCLEPPLGSLLWNSTHCQTWRWRCRITPNEAGTIQSSRFGSTRGTSRCRCIASAPVRPRQVPGAARCAWLA